MRNAECLPQPELYLSLPMLIWTQTEGGRAGFAALPLMVSLFFCTYATAVAACMGWEGIPHSFHICQLFKD